MPNALAYLMLLAWPVVTLVLFSRMRVERALVWTLLGGYLLLPPVAAFDLPGVPNLDKLSIPALSAYAVCTLMLGHRVPLLPASRTGRVLVLLFVLCAFATVVANGDPLVYPWGTVPALRLYDAAAILALQVIILLPFALARRFLATPEGLREVLLAFVLAGLAYSLPMLLEVRLSPQLNVWIYGFFQHSFEQMIRFGGFRPVVFLEHGLWAALFALTAFLAALAMARRHPPEERIGYTAAALWLGVLLVLCKSAGVLVYGAILAPVILLAGTRTQIRVAGALALLALCYPLLRGAGLVPVDEIVALAGRIDAERAASLGFRFVNEDALLAHAFERPLFGWGGYGRNLLRDAATGEILTISDGRWIIVLGMFGFAGFVAEFGLLVLPLIALARRPGRWAAVPWAGPCALLLAVNLVDMLPNATLIPLTWLLAGALTGCAEARGAVVAARPAPLPARQRTVM